MMKRFSEQTFAKREDAQNPKFALLKADLSGHPSTTIITASIDPLRSEGEALANAYKAAGVNVNYRNYEGVTHEFFGMGAVVDKAKEAVQFAAEDLKASFK